jgi:hypothetical protein
LTSTSLLRSVVLERTSTVNGQPRTNTFWHPEKLLRAGNDEDGDGDELYVEQRGLGRLDQVPPLADEPRRLSAVRDAVVDRRARVPPATVTPARAPLPAAASCRRA